MRPVTFAKPSESRTTPGRTVRGTEDHGPGLPGVGRAGLPGTVLYENGTFRAWFDQTEQVYFESHDGLHFVERHDLDKSGFAKPLIWTHSGRRVRRNTWTVATDPSAPLGEKYKAAYACADAGSASGSGHTPGRLPCAGPFTRACAKVFSKPPWELSVEVPYYKGRGQWWWESTCIAYSADGLLWTEYDIGKQNATGRTLPEPLRMAGDTSNAIYPDEAARVHRVINRWNAALPQGSYGTTNPNRNWWREVRGVRVSSNAGLTAADGGTPADWREDIRWLFDREGPTEHMRRQAR